MTMSDARMIAEELYRLLERDGQIHNESVGVEDAAEIMGCSASFVYHNISEIPHTKIGRSLRFRTSDIHRYMRERRPS